MFMIDYLNFLESSGLSKVKYLEDFSAYVGINVEMLEHLDWDKVQVAFYKESVPSRCVYVLYSDEEGSGLFPNPYNRGDFHE